MSLSSYPLGRRDRRTRRDDLHVPSALAGRMCQLSRHEQVALREGIATLTPVAGCVAIWWHCVVRNCNALISIRPKDRRRPPRFCSRHAGLRHTIELRHAVEPMLPRIVVLSDDLWTALEVAWHQIATYATRLNEARR